MRGSAVSLAAHAIEEIQERFAKDFPPHPKEKEYLYGTASTLKPTRAVATEGSLNQVGCVLTFDTSLS